MNAETQHRTIETGDFVGAAWGASPYALTPYAEAIASHYPIQVPWLLSTPITIGGATPGPGPLVVSTRPQLYDVLIVGMSARAVNVIADTGESFVEVIGLQITHKETGIPWAAPNTLGFVPLPAI